MRNDSLMMRIRFFIYLKHIFYGFALSYIVLVFKEIKIDAKGIPLNLGDSSFAKCIVSNQNWLIAAVIFVLFVLLLRQRIGKVKESRRYDVWLIFIIGLFAALTFNAKYPFDVLNISIVEPVLYGIKTIVLFLSLFLVVYQICMIIKKVFLRIKKYCFNREKEAKSNSSNNDNKADANLNKDDNANSIVKENSIDKNVDDSQDEKLSKSKYKSNKVYVNIKNVISKICKWLEESKNNSQFLSDLPIENENEDLLGFKDRAEKFAERVYNGSELGINVFAVDAPWGSGKTSFINLFRNYINNKYKSKVIFYEFSPIAFDKDADIRGKFIDGISSVIDENFYIPEFRPLFNRFARIVKIKNKASFAGLEFELFPENDYESIHNDLKSVLGKINKKIIVIIDDLDRVDWAVIKNLLQSIKKEFDLPNMSYILCYDTKNILKQFANGCEGKTDISFLEKFIHLKFNLVPSREKMKESYDNYIKGNFGKKGKPLAERLKRTLFKLNDLFKDKDYEKYENYIGNPRKYKRLINSVILLNLDGSDIDQYDIDEMDLIHLLILYIWHPEVYLDFVKFVEENFENEMRWGDEKKYTKDKDDFLAKCNNYIIEKLLSNEKLRNVNSRFDNSREARFKSFREIVKWISFLEKSELYKQTNFYRGLWNRIKDGEKIESVITEIPQYPRGELNHYDFWSLLTRISGNKEILSDAAVYLMNHLTDYSFLMNRRDSIVKIMSEIIDLIRDKKEKDVYANISNIIFGEGKYAGKGLIKIITERSKTVLGIYDLIVFLSYCSSAFNIRNISSALALHAGEPDEGKVPDLIIGRLRELSQKVYSIFKGRYIEKKINMFKELDNLQFEDLCGSFCDYYMNEFKGKEEQITRQTINNTKYFIIYQLGSQKHEYGIGCGYYDPVGKEDKQGINKEFNDYLFDVCFNAEEERNIKYFYDYCMSILLQLYVNHHSYEWELLPAQLCDVLDWGMFNDYWIKNKDEIEKIHKQAENKEEYSDKLFNKLYEYMDKFLSVAK